MKFVTSALVLLLVAGLLPTGLLAGCSDGDAREGGEGGETTAEQPASTAVSVVDQTGATVALDKPAERVVTLTAASAEIVYAVGAGSTVVGRGEYCDWPAEILDIPAVQSGSETNIEQIIALDPDLVILATMDQNPEQVAQLTDAGIAVYVSTATDIAQTYESIEQIGVLFGREAEAAAIVDGMKASFDELAAAQLSGTVYFEVSPLEYGLWAAGNATFMNEVAEIIGLENIFADVEGWVEVSEEQVLERNPDYIVTVGMYFGEGLKPDEEVLARANWQGVAAVRNGAVINFPNNEFARPGPRLAEGAVTLYDFIVAHPLAG
ncbi:MAG: ABC transporter substrate-binding protein [Coriobacteriales bacterium]|jgi:iron complex transport system substrate-binding protein|nr:ABC transporter substrate-binding protein [Coriobacteriales bacterium]